jgi:cytochrome c oxidase assembly protein subunit 11
MTKNTRLALHAGIIAVSMLMLAYASVPLYKLFCATTGYGGTTQTGKTFPTKISDRVMTIRFNADIDPALPWKFAPGEKSVKVKVGEQFLTYFTAENLTNSPVKGRAVYNVVPTQAGIYFVKVECFCFTEQTLTARQKVNMPVSFFIDPSILDDKDMDDVNTITLSYTFFPHIKQPSN